MSNQLSRKELFTILESFKYAPIGLALNKGKEQRVLPPGVGQEMLRVSDSTPEKWGGASKFEIITTYVHSPGQFTGQVVFYASQPLKKAQVIVSGLDGQEKIIQGFNYLAGENRVEFNTSLLGIGFPAQENDPNQSFGYLLYYPATLYYPSSLQLIFNNFPIKLSPNDEERQYVTFNVFSTTDPDKMRILSGTDFEEDTLRYYMRIGDKDPETGAPNFLMIAHTNIRDLTKNPALPQHPMVGFDPEGGQLYILQKDIDIKHPGHKPYVWLWDKPWMQHPESVSGGIETKLIDGLIRYHDVPTRINLAYGGKGYDDIYPGLEHLTKFSLPVDLPSFDFDHWTKKDLVLATLPAKLVGHFAKETQINFMFQTTGFRSLFFPSVEGSGKRPVITPPYPPSQP